MDYPMTSVFAELVAGLLMTAGFCFLFRLILKPWPLKADKETYE